MVGVAKREAVGEQIGFINVMTSEFARNPIESVSARSTKRSNDSFSNIVRMRRVQEEDWIKLLAEIAQHEHCLERTRLKRDQKVLSREINVFAILLVDHTSCIFAARLQGKLERRHCHEIPLEEGKRKRDAQDITEAVDNPPSVQCDLQ